MGLNHDQYTHSNPFWILPDIYVFLRTAQYNFSSSMSKKNVRGGESTKSQPLGAPTAFRFSALEEAEKEWESLSNSDSISTLPPTAVVEHIRTCVDLSERVNRMCTDWAQPLRRLETELEHSRADEADSTTQFGTCILPEHTDLSTNQLLDSYQTTHDSVSRIAVGDSFDVGQLTTEWRALDSLYLALQRKLIS